MANIDKAFGVMAYCRGVLNTLTPDIEKAKIAYEENTAPGCYAFHCMKRRKRFAGWTYKFSDKYGVHYYGE